MPLLPCLALLPIASAATVTWSGLGGDDEWSTGGNRVGGVAPTAGDWTDWSPSITSGSATLQIIVITVTASLAP